MQTKRNFLLCIFTLLLTLSLCLSLLGGCVGTAASNGDNAAGLAQKADDLLAKDPTPYEERTRVDIEKESDLLQPFMQYLGKSRDTMVTELSAQGYEFTLKDGVSLEITDRTFYYQGAPLTLEFVFLSEFNNILLNFDFKLEQNLKLTQEEYYGYVMAFIPFMYNAYGYPLAADSSILLMRTAEEAALLKNGTKNIWMIDMDVHDVESDAWNEEFADNKTDKRLTVAANYNPEEGEAFLRIRGMLQLRYYKDKWLAADNFYALPNDTAAQ